MEKYFDVDKELKSFKCPVPKDFQKRAVHFAQEPEQWNSRAMVPPIHLSSMYQLPDQEDWKYLYLRVGSPSRDVLQKCFANLNDGKHALMFSTGQGATSSLMISLGTGAHIIVCKYIYGATSGLFMKEGAELGLTHSIVDLSDLDALRAAITPQTKMVFFESPTNPVLRCFDIKAISDTVHAINKNIIVAFDNTFMSPYLQRPLNLGVDVVMYSCSKYVNGHSDVVMGSLVMNDDKIYDKLRGVQIRMGNVPSPFDCYMVLRGMKTLALRMREHTRNSIVVAKFLQEHPAVEKVAHPGLFTDISHDIAVKQSSGHSGMIAFWIKNVNLQQAKELLNKLKVITVSGSLGGMESTINLPFVISAASQPRELKEDAGITENCVRLSVGLEEPEYLIEDLNNVLSTLP